MRVLNKRIWQYQAFVKNNIDINRSGMEQWCNEYIGKCGRAWYSFGEAGRVCYAFNDESSLLIFKLTWGKYGN